MSKAERDAANERAESAERQRDLVEQRVRDGNDWRQALEKERDAALLREKALRGAMFSALGIIDNGVWHPTSLIARARNSLAAALKENPAQGAREGAHVTGHDSPAVARAMAGFRGRHAEVEAARQASVEAAVIRPKSSEGEKEADHVGAEERDEAVTTARREALEEAACMVEDIHVGPLGGTKQIAAAIRALGEK